MAFGFKVEICILVKVCGFMSLVLGAGLPDHFRVAGLFEPEYESLELAFKSAIEKMNLHHVVGPGRLIVYDVKNTPQRDSFEANKEVCRQMKEGIAAVFGPVSKIPRGHVQSICEAFDIPHLQAQWDSRESRGDFSISVYPDHNALSGAFAALIKEWGWKKFTIIYEDNDSLIRLQEVLKASKGPDYSITVRKLDPYPSRYISMFRDIKDKKEFHIIIDCDVDKVQPILHEALRINMLSEYYHFHFTTLDLGMVNLDDYKYGGANITSMRLIDPARPEVMAVQAEWLLAEHDFKTKSPLLGHDTLRTETALIYDAVHLFALSLADKYMSEKTTEPLNCNKKQTWKDGMTLLNIMRSMVFEGLSGTVKFVNGKRVDFKLDIIELTQNGLRTVGNWQPYQGVNITTSYKERVQENLAKLQNKTLKVVTVFEEPYMKRRKTPDDRGRMEEGFMVDLLDNIADRLGFNYSIYEAPDQTYGIEQSNGEWTGIMGELMHKDSEKRADLAGAGMTITYVREKVVDFTKPFLNLGITILYKKPMKSPPELFSFSQPLSIDVWIYMVAAYLCVSFMLFVIARRLRFYEAPFLNLGITILYKKPMKSPPELFSFSQPLSIDVWIYMVAAYLCVSFMLFVIARFSPYEWQNPHPCNEDSDMVENQFTILNSLWFTIGSLMQQGSDIAPRSLSARLVASVWYLFTLIMISSYTANLASSLTVEKMVSPIESVDDLSKQTSIKYGTLNSGSTKQFFMMSDIPTYKRMWSFMEANKDTVFVNNTPEGVRRVLNEDYAYLAESPTIDYIVQKNCKTLTQIGGLLDSKGYGIATPKDSPWTEYISNEIIYLQESQVIHKLYTKWWKEKSGGTCVEEKSKDASALGIKHVGGVFVVLIGGLIAGLLLACVEFMWKARKNARIDKQSFCSEISEELRFAIRCMGKSGKATRRSTSKDIVDNGIQFAPLTGIPNNRTNAKELYA